jgi:NAD(P)-dependent dehydrogenase (short-subunit alcohol dehydrogenase family)
VPRIFITGSTDGLGRAAAGALLGEGHDVVLHARTRERAAALSDLAPDAAGVVIGDLSSAAETREIAGQVNQIGRMDAVIHNAGVYLEPSRGTTAEGHAKTLAVNSLAPYMLTALIDRPDRLIYLSSGLHHAGAGSLRDIDWTTRPWNAARAYAESKLHVTALALTLARVWPEVLSNAVDPGWVPTRMGGPAATGDLEMGYLTQTWLAVSNDDDATVSGGYWYHRQRQAPAPQARDPAFQDQLMDRLAALAGVTLFLAPATRAAITAAWWIHRYPPTGLAEPVPNDCSGNAGDRGYDISQGRSRDPEDQRIERIEDKSYHDQH